MRMSHKRIGLFSTTSFSYDIPDKPMWTMTARVPLIGWYAEKKQYYRCMIDQDGNERWLPITPEQVPDMVSLRVLRNDPDELEGKA
jgi:hypothetical protein